MYYMSDYIHDFIEHLEVEGGRMPKTAENYDFYLQRFLEFAGDIKVDTIDMSSFESIDYG